MTLLPKGAIIHNWLCSRIPKLIPKPLNLAVTESLKFCKILTSAKVANCHFCIERTSQGLAWWCSG